MHCSVPRQVGHKFCRTLTFPEEDPPDEELLDEPPEEEFPEELLSVEGAGLSTSFPPLPSQEEQIPVPLHIEHFVPNCTPPPLQYGHTPEAPH